MEENKLDSLENNETVKENDVAVSVPEDGHDKVYNPTVKTFKLDRLTKKLEISEENYSFITYLKQVLCNPLQNFPKYCNKYAFWILGVSIAMMFILVFSVTNLIMEHYYPNIQNFSKYRKNSYAQLIRLQFESRLLLILFLIIIMFLVYVFVDKLVSKWLLREKLNYLDLVAKYAQILVIPIISGVSVVIMVWLKLPSILVFSVASVGLYSITIGQLGQLLLRAKSAVNSRVSPFYFVLIIQCVIIVLATLLASVG